MVNPLHHVKEYAKLREERDQVKELLESINFQLEEMELAAIQEMQTLGLQNFKLATGNTVYLSHDISASLVRNEEDKVSDSVAAIKKSRFARDLVTDSVNVQTLGKWVRTRKAEGKGIPESLKPYIDVVERDLIKIRRK